MVFLIVDVQGMTGQDAMAAVHLSYAAAMP